MASEKQKQHLQKLRDAQQYRGGKVPDNQQPVYQEKTQQADAAADSVSLMCTAPMCREAWSVHVPDRGIFHKCTMHAWAAQALRTPAAGAPMVDPFEGVPLFREHGMRAWAYRLKFRADRGDELTRFQTMKYRAALGLKG